MRTLLKALLFGQPEEELYSTNMLGAAHPEVRRLLLLSRKETRRLDLLGKPCGPMQLPTGPAGGALPKIGAGNPSLAAWVEGLPPGAR